MTQGPPPGPFCQSCSMPMTEPGKFGTNADGTRNETYCTHCYQGGKFTQPDATVDGMVAKVAEIMAGMGMPADLIEKTKRVIPMLGRWRKA